MHDIVVKPLPPGCRLTVIPLLFLVHPYHLTLL